MGDELTKVLPFVHVPEAFERRFQELRSANNAIASIASIAAGVLYGLVGCILGALWLLRQRWLVWKPPLVAGMVIGALLAATMLANTPTAWFGFATSQDESTFWVRQIGLALLVWLGGGLALAEVFMAAEGLTRRAFPQHPQLWRLWSRDAAGTLEIAGRTAGGYLFVPIELALIAVFYYVTNQWLGWWQPSEALTDPNILSSVVPALTPISIARAGRLHGGVRVPCGAPGARCVARCALWQARPWNRHRVRAAGRGVWRCARQLSGLSFLFAPGRADGAVADLGADVPALRSLPTILLHALFDLALISIPLFLVEAPGAGGAAARW